METYTKRAIRGFLWGLMLGVILQSGISFQREFEARLLSSFTHTTKKTSVTPTVHKPRTTMAERVHRRMLLRSAQRQGMRMLLVADAGTLHNAAFPAFDHTVFPVTQIPNWGAMHTAIFWNRTYSEMTPEDFVAVPAYDLSVLTIPLASLQQHPSQKSEAVITAKLFYSTRYFAAYDIDADEFTGMHSGVDLKLARGTPVAAIAGGMVRYAQSDGALGLHVMIEHRLSNGERYFSIYGHFDSTSVQVGDSVAPGQIIGTVGMTGSTTGPHLHLQVDRDNGSGMHTPYEPLYVPTKEEIALLSVNPITFIAQHARNNQ